MPHVLKVVRCHHHGYHDHGYTTGRRGAQVEARDERGVCARRVRPVTHACESRVQACSTGTPRAIVLAQVHHVECRVRREPPAQLAILREFPADEPPRERAGRRDAAVSASGKMAVMRCWSS